MLWEIVGENEEVVDQVSRKIVEEFMEFLWQLISVINHLLIVVHIFLDSSIPPQHRHDFNVVAKVVEGRSVKVDVAIAAILESLEEVDIIKDSAEEDEYDGGKVDELDEHFIDLKILLEEFGMGDQVCG